MKTTPKNKGMTLIEAIISIFILILGLVPIFMSITVTNNLAIIIKNDLIASNLAREGIEVVRSIRDANWFNGLLFDANLADCGQSICDWVVPWDSAAPIPLGANPPLKIDSTTGLYNYSTGSNSLFTRKISISRVGTCNCEIKILSQVSWPERKDTKVITVESHLFNWR